MRDKLSALIVLVRPRHWVKNLALFASPFFSGHLFDIPSLVAVSWGVVAYCLLSSSSYVFNDILDAESDRRHPYKKHRPIASGLIRMPNAFILVIGLALLGLGISWFLGMPFVVLALAFLLIHYLNSFILRRLVLIDVLAISAGHILRVYAGVAASGYHISIWLSLAVLSLSLFVAIGKRRSEYTLLLQRKEKLGKQRKLLMSGYSEQMLNTYTAMFGTATFITYVYYTFLASSASVGFFQSATMTILDRKWMMITIPFVLYGIMRYLQIVYEEKGGTLEKLVTADIPLLTTLAGWTLTAFFVLYGIGR